MKNINKYVYITTLSVLSLIILSCSAKFVKPLYMSESLNQNGIDNVFILPIVDFRILEENEKEESRADANELITDIIKSRLKAKGYKSNIGDDLSLTADIEEEDLENIDKNWLIELGPQDAQWLFLPVLEGSESSLTFGSTGNAEISGYLFYKKDGSNLWHNKGVGQAGQGGLIGMMMVGMMEEEAIRKATETLMIGFPIKGKKN